MVLEENFSSFKTEQDSSNKRYFLFQTWSTDSDQNYLRLTLSDCSNYWIGHCKINYLL